MSDETIPSKPRTSFIVYPLLLLNIAASAFLAFKVAMPEPPPKPAPQTSTTGCRIEAVRVDPKDPSELTLTLQIERIEDR